MIIEEVVGNLRTLQLGQRHIERVPMHSSDLLKRIQRVQTDHGRELGIRLSQTSHLLDGDVLWMDDQNAIVVDVVSEDILVISPTHIRQMGEVAHQLGNRHLPVQFEGDTLLAQYDYLVEQLLANMNVAYTRTTRKVSQAFQHIGHHHG